MGRRGPGKQHQAGVNRGLFRLSVILASSGGGSLGTSMKKILCGLASLALTLAVAPAVLAQSYPIKPVKIYVGFPPGGPSDTSTRILAEELAKALGQPFVIESKPGAGGNIAADAVARATPDGYTLFAGNSGALGVNPSLYAMLPFDAAKDFHPITMMVVTPMVFMVPSAGPANSLGALIALLKKDGARANYGTPGVGTLPHIVAEMFKNQAQVRSEHVPYRGTGPMMEGLTSGELHWALDSPVAAAGPARAGKVRVLAITAESRWPSLPEVPTTAESGLPALIEHAWFALVGPAGLPRDVVTRLHGAASAALHKPELNERMVNLGMQPKPMSPEDTAKYMADTRERWGEVVRANRMKVE
jgi:tripartite-type tricarboxylate transporter receptor subunit TctC